MKFSTIDRDNDVFSEPLMKAQNVHWSASGMKFSTIDRDNDVFSSVNCAGPNAFLGGWWYNRCGTSIINGDGNGMWNPVSDIRDVQASRMLVKLN